MQALSSRLVLRRLGLLDEAEFAELAGLYQQAFPANERKPLDVLRRMLAAPGYHFLLATEDSVTVGFAIVRALRGSGAALLEYMAVAASHRGRGLGRQMLQATADAVDAPEVTLLVEVESDRAEKADRVERARRKHFYRSQGAREVEGLSWIMPPVIDALPPAMEMMAFTPAAQSVRRTELRRWLVEIYVEVYGQSTDDARIDAMLADLPEEVRLV